ncbi:hypothetical protein [Brevibacillus sp. SYSU BS000544]|uniref:hypothetical protein n=1 Tax=Brevibacillus sp. SYSU BS000544 TaxID=3416443 RepID=UPI003CE4DD3D
MIPIRRGLLSALILSLLVSMTGCNANENKADASVKYNAIRDQFLAQSAYSFYGRTKLVTGSTTNSNLVNYSGVVQGKDVYLDLRLSNPAEKSATMMSLVSRGPELFVKSSKQSDWSPVAGQDFSVRQEFENWNPIANVYQMDQLKARVLPLRDGNREDDFGAVRVLLDSNKLKNWLREQVRSQQRSQTLGIQSNGMRTTAIHTPKLKMMLSLDEGIGRQGTATIQANQSNSELDNMIDNMELEAEYTIHYDRKNLLPTKLTMAIRSQYVHGNQNVVEHSEIETFIRDYGTKARIPSP